MDRFDAAWRDLRRRQMLFWGLWLLFVPYSAIWLNLASQEVAIRPIGVYALCWLVSGYWRMAFRCPRCKSAFLYGRTGLQGLRDAFSGRCPHCGLRKWQSE